MISPSNDESEKSEIWDVERDRVWVLRYGRSRKLVLLRESSGRCLGVPESRAGGDAELERLFSLWLREFSLRRLPVATKDVNPQFLNIQRDVGLECRA